MPAFPTPAFRGYSMYSSKNVPQDVCCSTSATPTCGTASLLKARISSFHDEELAEATTRINQILDELKKHNQDPERDLALLSVAGSGYLLAWVRPGVSHDSDPQELRRALGIE
ncbi:MAG: hypothetical protein JO202_12505 [Ktedonobacteraceae bacterium]|nr:hypothetical protein [Ktedonobacteraceae bacterium]